MTMCFPRRLAVLLLLALAFAAAPLLAVAEPVQVYILLGQSNMVGSGIVTGTTDGNLAGAVFDEGLYPYLKDGTNWSTRNDVRHVRVMSSGLGDMGVYNNEWMSVSGEGDNKIGPEYGIGQALGEAIDAPVMVLKSCIGNRSLGWDLLPPGSEQFQYNDGTTDWTYAGYGESPMKWETGTTPTPINWYAGLQYDGDIRNAKTVLDNLGTYYPGATEYEVAGFFFWQGDKDRYDTGLATRYEQSLVQLIEQLRVEFNAPNANFVCATLGQTDIDNPNPDYEDRLIFEAQLAVDGNAAKYPGYSGQHPQFEDNVATVYSHPLSLGGASNSHYNSNAKTYMNVGEAMGEAMVAMIKTLPTVTVDLQTGEIKIVNPVDGDIEMAFKDLTITSATGALDPTSWDSIAGNYDLAGDGSVDDDGNWDVTSATNGLLSEAAQAGGGDGLISIAQEVSLGVGAWVQNLDKDLQVTYTDPNGLVKVLTVRYVGTPIGMADLNFDGVVDASDWPIFLAGNQVDLSGMTAAQAYQAGDLDGDGDNDIWDFVLFKEAYEAANPAASFEEMVASYVPEPSSMLLLAFGAAGLAARKRRRGQRSSFERRSRGDRPGRKSASLGSLGIAVLALGLAAGAAQAQTTTYSGATGNWNIDTWNDAGNWDNGIPAGAIDANIADGEHVSVRDPAGTTTPVYTGDLILGVGSMVQIAQTSEPNCLNALGTGTWIMNAGSDITLRYAQNSTHSNDITLLGDATIAVNRSTSAHHKTRTFNGRITGPGQLIVHTTNNNTVKFTNSTSDWSGGLWAGDIHDENNRATIQGDATGSLGTGDVRIDRDVELIINAENAMSTGAMLTLNGPGRSDRSYKLKLNADQTVAEFWLDGTQAIAGTVLDSSASFLDGSGTLTVTGGAADLAPILVPNDIVDQAYGGPIYEDTPAFIYHMTFNDDMDPSTITAADFESVGTAPVSIGAVSKIFTPDLANDPSIFSVEVLPSGLGTVQLQVKAGADLKDVGGNALDTALAITDADIIDILAGSTPPSTITGTDGGNNSWNTASNWDNGVPWGVTPAIVAAGVAAKVDGDGTPSYSGGLTLEQGASLQVGWTTSYATNVNALGTGTITMKDGSQLISRSGLGNYTFNQHFVLQDGNCTIWAGISTANHHTTKTFAGGISGAGRFIYNGVNNTTIILNTANPDWSGGFASNDPQNQGHRVKATADGAFGTGDVYINANCTLFIQSPDTIDDAASLYLNGIKSSKNDSYKLVMDADETVYTFALDGTLLAPGDYTSASGLVDINGSPLIGGGGTLTVLSGPVLKLLVDKFTGDITVVGHESQEIELNYYQITSEGESLDADNWSSLQDQDFEGGGGPSGMGDGWEEAGGAGKHALAEAYLLGSSTIGASASVSLGEAYDPAVGIEDLVFTYNSGETVIVGDVEYVSSAPSGDANGDGVVDAADYLLIKRNLGGAPSGDGTGGDLNGDGVVNWLDLNALSSAMSAGGAGGTIPEPATLSLVALCGLALLRRRRS